VPDTVTGTAEQNVCVSIWHFPVLMLFLFFYFPPTVNTEEEDDDAGLCRTKQAEKVSCPWCHQAFDPTTYEVPVPSVVDPNPK
jgi:hypothetical protein